MDPKNDWFESIEGGDDLSWVYKVTGNVDSLLSIGCWTDEPIALLWTTRAEKLTVIELESEYIEKLQERIASLNQHVPDALKGRTIKFLEEDIGAPIDVLKQETFDCIFCRNVLYNLEESSRLELAIKQMATALKKNGKIIVCEGKLGVEYQRIPFPLPYDEVREESIYMPVLGSEPTDISNLFEDSGLTKICVDKASGKYVYQKV